MTNEKTTTRQKNAKSVLEDAIQTGILDNYVFSALLEDTQTHMYLWGETYENMVSLFINEEGSCYYSKPYALQESDFITIDKAVLEVKNQINDTANRMSPEEMWLAEHPEIIYDAPFDHKVSYEDNLLLATR
jgi:hypothetical protein